MASAPEAVEPSASTSAAHPSAASGAATASVGASRVDVDSRGSTAARSRHHPAGRPRAARWAAPVIPGEPATTQTAAFHLWRVARPRREPPGDVGRLDQVGAGPTRCRGRCRPPRPRLRAGPSARSSPGLSAAKVTVRRAAGARPPTSPVRPSTPEGMSTASTGVPRVGRRGVVRAPEPGAVGGVDDQIGGRAAPRRRRRRRTTDPDAPAAEPTGRVPAVVAVVALAGHHHDPAAVGPAQHLERGPGHRAAGPVDQHLDRFGAAAVDRRPSPRGSRRGSPPMMPHGCSEGGRRSADRFRGPDGRSYWRREGGGVGGGRNRQPHRRLGARLCSVHCCAPPRAGSRASPGSCSRLSTTSPARAADGGCPAPALRASTPRWPWSRCRSPGACSSPSASPSSSGASASVASTTPGSPAARRSFTLGFAKPDGPGLIWLTFVEATIGLGIVALLISYLPTLYTAYSAREQGVGHARPRHRLATVGHRAALATPRRPCSAGVGDLGLDLQRGSSPWSRATCRVPGAVPASRPSRRTSPGWPPRAPSWTPRPSRCRSAATERGAAGRRGRRLGTQLGGLLVLLAHGSPAMAGTARAAGHRRGGPAVRWWTWCWATEGDPRPISVERGPSTSEARRRSWPRPAWSAAVDARAGLAPASPGCGPAYDTALRGTRRPDPRPGRHLVLGPGPPGGPAALLQPPTR